MNYLEEVFRKYYNSNKASQKECRVCYQTGRVQIRAVSVLSFLTCEEGTIEAHICWWLLVDICKVLKTVPGT